MMEKFFKVLGLALPTAVCLALGCVAAMPSLQHLEKFEKMERVADEGESEIVVVGFGEDIAGLNGVQVLVNGNTHTVLSEDNGLAETIIVPNGRYVIDVRHPGEHLKSYTNIPVNAVSARIILGLRIVPIQLTTSGLTPAHLKLTRYTEVAFDKLNTPPSTPQSPKACGLEDAIKKAGNSLIDKLPLGSKIAVVNIASSDMAVSTLVINELEFYLVSADAFTIVDRSALDIIRREQIFQMSGEVSDESVVQIGNLVGANIVISGSVNEAGGTNRLSLKAMDVRTGQIITMARESY